LSTNQVFLSTNARTFVDKDKAAIQSLGSSYLNQAGLTSNTTRKYIVVLLAGNYSSSPEKHSPIIAYPKEAGLLG
jgi:hypothetical protein